MESLKASHDSLVSFVASYTHSSHLERATNSRRLPFARILAHRGLSLPGLIRVAIDNAGAPKARKNGMAGLLTRSRNDFARTQQTQWKGREWL